MEEVNRVDEILDFLEKTARENKVLPPGKWCDLAQDLNSLLSGETDLLHELNQKEAQYRVGLMEDGKSAAASKTYSEASDIYRQAKRQESRVERILEQIRIAKIQSRLKDTEYSYSDK